MKGLFDFGEPHTEESSEPTCVVSEEKVCEEIEKTSQVYLTSEAGFNTYCRECWKLLLVQETGSNYVPIRVFCKVEKCVK